MSTLLNFFQLKGVDYQGEEIRLARYVVWECIEASLPDRVGMLDLRDFCEGGVLYYIHQPFWKLPSSST